MTNRTREEIEREIIDVAGDRGWLRGRGKRPPPTPGCDQRLTELFAELAALAPDPQPAQAVRESLGRHLYNLRNPVDSWSDLPDRSKERYRLQADTVVAAFPHLATPASEAAWRAGPLVQRFLEACAKTVQQVGPDDQGIQADDLEPIVAYETALGDFCSQVTFGELRALATPVEQAAPGKLPRKSAEQAVTEVLEICFDYFGKPAADPKAAMDAVCEVFSLRTLNPTAPASTGEDVRERAAKFISEMTMRSTYIGGIAADALIFAGLLRTTPDLAATGGEQSADEKRWRLAADRVRFLDGQRNVALEDYREFRVLAVRLMGCADALTALRERAEKAERQQDVAEILDNNRLRQIGVLQTELATARGEAERLREAHENALLDEIESYKRIFPSMHRRPPDIFDRMEVIEDRLYNLRRSRAALSQAATDACKEGDHAE